MIGDTVVATSASPRCQAFPGAWLAASPANPLPAPIGRRWAPAPAAARATGILYPNTVGPGFVL